MKKAVILLSGGLDSTTVAAYARSQGFELYALTIDYNQRHIIELVSAERVATAIEVKEHKIVPLDMAVLGGSSLTGSMDVPKNTRLESIGNEIPSTYVPARNTIFLSIALAYAETIDANDIFIGISNVDYSGYPDCRAEYLAKFEELANLATQAGVEKNVKYSIHAPLMHMSKGETVKLGLSLGVDYSMTHSCYDPLLDGRSCGVCESCQLRLKGFQDAGLTDEEISLLM